MTPQNVKIMGFPRSGTSLLQRLLDAHRQVYAPPEPYVFAGAARMIAESRGEGPDLGMLTGLGFAGFPPDEVIARVRRFAMSFMDEGAAAAGKPVWAEKSAFDILVVSRMWWKLPNSGLRACNVGSSQAARSRDIGTRG